MESVGVEPTVRAAPFVGLPHVDTEIDPRISYCSRRSRLAQGSLVARRLHPSVHAPPGRTPGQEVLIPTFLRPLPLIRVNQYSGRIRIAITSNREPKKPNLSSTLQRDCPPPVLLSCPTLGTYPGLHGVWGPDKSDTPEMFVADGNLLDTRGGRLLEGSAAGYGGVTSRGRRLSEPGLVEL